MSSIYAILQFVLLMLLIEMHIIINYTTILQVMRSKEFLHPFEKGTFFYTQREFTLHPLLLLKLPHLHRQIRLP